MRLLAHARGQMQTTCLYEREATCRGRFVAQDCFGGQCNQQARVLTREWCSALALPVQTIVPVVAPLGIPPSTSAHWLPNVVHHAPMTIYRAILAVVR